VAVTAIGEALNYAADPRAGIDQLVRLAGRVHDALEPGGVFLFDIATRGKGTPVPPAVTSGPTSTTSFVSTNPTG
jgi:hypothetical protein